MYRLLSMILLTLTLCACSLAPPVRPSPPENTLRTSPPPTPSLSPSPSPAPSLSSTLSPLPTPFGHDSIRELVYPDFMLRSMRVLAQHEYEGVTVTQFHYLFELDGELYEGTNINAEADVYWKKEWMLEFIGEGGWQYDHFSPFVPDRDRIYLLLGLAISAREVATGEEIWTLVLHGGPYGGVADSNGNLYVSCTESPFMTAITPNGEILWQVDYVDDYYAPYNVRLVDDEIIISMFYENDDHDVHFDFDGNYRIVKR